MLLIAVAIGTAFYDLDGVVDAFYDACIELVPEEGQDSMKVSLELVGEDL